MAYFNCALINNFLEVCQIFQSCDIETKSDLELFLKKCNIVLVWYINQLIVIKQYRIASNRRPLEAFE